MAWEKEQTSGVRLAEEIEGVFTYQSESKDHKGILLEGSASDFSLASVEGASPSFKGFGLVIINLEKVRSHFPRHSNSHHHIMQLVVKSKQNFSTLSEPLGTYLSVSRSLVSLRVSSVRFQRGSLLEVGGRVIKTDNKFKYLFQN